MTVLARLAICSAALVSGAVLHSPVHAACALKIADVSTVSFQGHSGKGYEVFDRDQHAQVVTVKVQRNSGSCSFVLGFSAGGSGSFGNRQLRAGSQALNYHLAKNVSGTQILKDRPVASSEEVFTGTLSAGHDSASFQFYFVIPFMQSVAPNSYRDTVTMSVYEGSLQSAQLRDQETLDLVAPVPTTAEFILGNTIDFEAGDRNEIIYFGEFSTGSIRELAMRARSNSGYRITMRSLNASKMLNLDLRERDQIPYSMTIDGVPVSLAGSDAVTAIQRNGTTSSLGNEHHLRFRVGDLANAGPGIYLDLIQVTLYPAR